MRAYVLSILQKISGQGQPMTDEGIIEWANQKASLLIYTSKCPNRFPMGYLFFDSRLLEVKARK